MAQRLKLIRLARGLSLEELVTKAGNVVTKQALSKYEMGSAQPSPRVLAAIASALQIKAIDLLNEPVHTIDCVAYRKKSKLGQKAMNAVESTLKLALEERTWLTALVQEKTERLPAHEFKVSKPEDVELAAESLREKWRLGMEPIANLTDVIENHGVHVVVITADDGFHGLSACAKSKEGDVVAAAVATNAVSAGERLRSNLAHELGHIVIKPTGMDEKAEERAALRFSSAFQAPRCLVFRDVGRRRSSVTLDELRIWKKRWKLSMQAIVYRLRDLDVISDSHCKAWFIQFSRLGWRKSEPDQLSPEKPQWLKRSVLHAFAEKLITKDRAEAILGESVQGQLPSTLQQRRALMSLPVETRRKILHEQAERSAKLYQGQSDELGGDDIREYNV